MHTNSTHKGIIGMLSDKPDDILWSSYEQVV